MEKHGIFVGSSGWTYNDWTGVFYPKGVYGSARLSYYAERFDTVEINATYYRVPTQSMIQAWNKRLGPEFHLVVKGPRVVTHLKRLKDCEESLALYLELVLQLTRLKVVLWQLPPSLRKDIPRLEAFLSQLPTTVRHAVEFRHESWWDDETTALLSRYKAAFVTVSHPNLPDVIIPTTDFLYVRFHGVGEEKYRYYYSDEELTAWCTKIAPFLDTHNVYAFFNNDYDANAPANAVTLRDMLQRRRAAENTF